MNTNQIIPYQRSPRSLSETILFCLNNYSQSNSLGYLPYVALVNQCQGLGFPPDYVEFTRELRFLIQEGHIQEEAGHYRITPGGQTHYYALINPRPDYEKESYIEARKSRSLATYDALFTFVGLALSFITLVIMLRACSTDEPTNQPMASVPTLQPADTSLKVGDEVIIVLSGTVFMRRTPGYVGKTKEDQACVASTSEVFIIIGGPQYVDELWWWRVTNIRCGEGWMAQTRRNGEVILVRR